MDWTDVAVVVAAMLFSSVSFIILLDIVASFWDEEAEDVTWEEEW